ncbi:MAG: glycosyltransferase family 2 protein [Blastocatellia bacterium]|nr:glycosyltransferase family 2 protein [Blastocatellia bacterium]
MTSPFLSLVIPAYNEAARITDTLRTIAEYLGQQTDTCEVLVVDDGSQDDTAAIVTAHQPLFAQHNIQLRLISNPGNQGKGYSIRHGFLSAQGEIVLFSDADLSAPITESPKLLDPIRTGQTDVAFGSRALKDSYIGTHQPWSRELAGRTFNFLMRLLTGLPFADTQCGFKAFRRLPLIPVFERQRIFGFGFDVEILFLASRQGIRLCEIPIVWNDVEGSKVSLLRGLLAFWELVVIRFRHATGGYEKKTQNQPVLKPETLPQD